MKRFCVPLVLLLCGAVLTAVARLAPAQTSASIVGTKHNLSVTGPGTIKATSEQEICIFCHTPHGASPHQPPLWNRRLSPDDYTATYKPYTSSSLKASPGQPTGSSKLCLSCHDGTIALGAVLSRGQAITMANSVTTLPPGASNLGTDLSDDHPISFTYDYTLTQQDTNLRDPRTLPQAVKLDNAGALQCTTCHDPHNNTNDKFLVMANTNSELCNACHNICSSDTPEHQQCANCHVPHTSPSGPYLLTRATTSETCLVCHNGQDAPLLSGASHADYVLLAAAVPSAVGGRATPSRIKVRQGPNIAADLNKTSVHDTGTRAGQANEQGPNSVVCKDCHESHTMRRSTVTAPMLPTTLGRINGENINGIAVKRATFQYEVCLKCHAEKQAVQPIITRQIAQPNTRLKFSLTAVSYHPVAQRGKNTDVPSLKSPWTINSLMYCTDCHASDTSKAAGSTGSNGPHGSVNTALLVNRYSMADFTGESATAYALCYRCHDRNQVLGETSVPFPLHKKHVVDKQTPCSACHDAHGIPSAQGTSTNNAALINFDRSIVSANSSGVMKYERTSARHGRCYLKCHGVNHAPRTY